MSESSDLFVADFNDFSESHDSSTFIDYSLNDSDSDVFVVDYFECDSPTPTPTARECSGTIGEAAYLPSKKAMTPLKHYSSMIQHSTPIEQSKRGRPPHATTIVSKRRKLLYTRPAAEGEITTNRSSMAEQLSSSSCSSLTAASGTGKFIIH